MSMEWTNNLTRYPMAGGGSVACMGEAQEARRCVLRIISSTSRRNGIRLTQQVPETRYKPQCEPDWPCQRLQEADPRYGRISRTPSRFHTTWTRLLSSPRWIHLGLTQRLGIAKNEIGSLLRRMSVVRAERNKGLTSTFQSVDRKTCSMLRRPMVVSVAVMAHNWSIASSWDAMIRWE